VKHRLLPCATLALLIGILSTPARADPYQDRLIEGLAKDEADEATQTPYNGSGWPRGFSLETLWNFQNNSGQKSNAMGLKGSGYLDTALYGSFSGQATWQKSPSNGPTSKGSDTSFVLRQMGMPFDGGWRANNSLGMINLPLPDLARGGTRLTLPTPAIAGLSSHWQQASGWELLGAVGQAGNFQGYPVPGFNTSKGNYALVAVQQSLPNPMLPKWQWSGTLAQAQQVTAPFSFNPNTTSTTDASSAHFSLKHNFDATEKISNSFLQINALSGRQTGTDTAPKTNGMWLDSGASHGAHTHGAGLFWLQPNLNWLNVPMPQDLKGGYWRHNWRTRQWSTEVGLEGLGSVSGATAQGYFSNANVRYQLSSTQSFGAALTLRRYGVAAQSVLGYTQFLNGLGNTRLQLDFARTNTGEQQTKAQLDHDWSRIQIVRLSTSLGLEREQHASDAGPITNQGINLALNADGNLTDKISTGMGLQAYWRSGAAQYSLNSSLNWRLSKSWSLQANLYNVQGRQPSATALAASPLTSPTALTPPPIQNQSLFVSLRFDQSAGQARAPVGGTPGAAAGSLRGSVYLDDNKNTQRDALEKGAPNVTVVLDGRYSTQTDAQGQFEFNFVTAGPHVLTVITDNLALPWQLEKDGLTPVTVHTRETTDVHIGATKP
jgi:hypothetical protein